MPVTRKRLEKVIAAIKKRDTFSFDASPLNDDDDSLDVYPALEAASRFSPGTMGKASAFLAWTAKADTAFDHNGLLTRPIALRWGGNWIALQLAFLTEVWVTRLERDTQPERGFAESGTLVLSPNSEELENDLKRLFTAFAAMRKQKVIALAAPSWTQFGGWEAVAEVANHNPNRTAVFWHAEGHETAFDGSGRLVGHLHLHWRGDETQILAPLRAAGFELDAPSGDGNAIIVRSGPCADPGIELPPPEPVAPHAPPPPLRGDGLTECLRFEADEPKRVLALAFSRTAPTRLVVALGSDERGRPRRQPLVYELAHARVIGDLSAHSQNATCGGLHFLPDGRLLYSLVDASTGHREVALRVWREGETPTHELARYEMEHPSNRCLSAVDAAFTTIAVTTTKGIVLRGIGALEAPLPVAHTQIARPAASSPWDELACLGGEPVDDYPMLAMSPDARHLVWAAVSSSEAFLIERANAKVRWSANFFEGHSGGHALQAMRFSTSGEQVLATMSLARKDGPPPLWRTRVYRTADGTRAWPALEEALEHATCLSFHPLRPELAAGFGDGQVRLFAFPSAEELASVSIDSGGVTAIAFDSRGAELAAGTARGEVILFVRE